MGKVSSINILGQMKRCYVKKSGGWFFSLFSKTYNIINLDGYSYEGTLDKEGNFKQGKLIFPNGDIYEGKFENGYPNGTGKMTCIMKHENGTTYEDTYEGEFANGEPYGYCIKYHKNYDTGEMIAISTGDWTGRKLNGEATIERSGRTYKGKFKNGTPVGSFIVTQENGSVYEGSIDKNLRYSGYGKKTTTNGDIYEGNFKKDKEKGKGTYTFKANGVSIHGTWEDNKFKLEDGKRIFIRRDSDIYDYDVVMKDKNIRERHNELFVGLISTLDKSEEKYLLEKEYINTIKKKYNYKGSDNLGLLTYYKDLSGSDNETQINTRLLNQQIASIEQRIDNYVNQHNNFKVLKISIDNYDSDSGKQMLPFIEKVLNIAKKKGIKNILITNNDKLGKFGDINGREQLEKTINKVFGDKTDPNLNLFIKRNTNTIGDKKNLLFGKQYPKLGDNIKFLSNLWGNDKAVVEKYDPKQKKLKTSNKSEIKNMYDNVNKQTNKANMETPKSTTLSQSRTKLKQPISEILRTGTRTGTEIFNDTMRYTLQQSKKYTIPVNNIVHGQNSRVNENQKLVDNKIYDQHYDYPYSQELLNQKDKIIKKAQNIINASLNYEQKCEKIREKWCKFKGFDSIASYNIKGLQLNLNALNRLYFELLDVKKLLQEAKCRHREQYTTDKHLDALDIQIKDTEKKIALLDEERVTQINQHTNLLDIEHSVKLLNEKEAPVPEELIEMLNDMDPVKDAYYATEEAHGVKSTSQTLYLRNNVIEECGSGLEVAENTLNAIIRSNNCPKKLNNFFNKQKTNNESQIMVNKVNDLYNKVDKNRYNNIPMINNTSQEVPIR